jgi:hypothetical protein
MGRSFSFTFNGRLLSIRPLPVDEGWELWLLDGERRVTCGGRISIDEAVDAGRQGRDCIAARAEQMKSDILLAKLSLD